MEKKTRSKSPCSLVVVGDSSVVEDLRFVTSKYCDGEYIVKGVGSTSDFSPLSKCDMVVVDFESDKFEKVKNFMDNVTHRNVPVVILTSPENHELASQVFDSSQGLVDFVRKPVRSYHEEVKNRIEKIYSNVTRARKGAIFQQAFENKKNVHSEMKKKLVREEHEIEILKKNMSTPIQELFKRITEFIGRKNTSRKEFIELLESLVKTLTKVDLHRPDFKKMELKDETLEWLSSEFSRMDDFGDDGSPISPVVTPSATPNTPNTPNKRGNVRDYLKMLTKKSKLSDINFNNFEYSHEKLKDTIVRIFKEKKLLKTFGVDVLKFRKILDFIEDTYQKNPYHNFRHAIDVTQFVYYLLDRCGFDRYLSLFYQFTLLVCALFHDIGHPGVNENYLNSIGDNLSLRYNDRDVLERHHLCQMFSILKMKDYDILEGFSEKKFREFRKIAIEVILATNMKKHFRLVSEFQSKMSVFQSLDEFKKNEPRNSLLLLRAMIKIADVSNTARPYNIAKMWANHVLEEFFMQGDMEKRRGMAPHPMGDRNVITLEDSQDKFINFIVFPLYALVNCEGLDLSEPIDLLKQNQKEWCRVKKINDEKKKREEEEEEEKKKQSDDEVEDNVLDVEPRSKKFFAEDDRESLSAHLNNFTFTMSGDISSGEVSGEEDNDDEDEDEDENENGGEEESEERGEEQGGMEKSERMETFKFHVVKEDRGKEVSVAEEEQEGGPEEAEEEEEPRRNMEEENIKPYNRRRDSDGFGYLRSEIEVSEITEVGRKLNSGIKEKGKPILLAGLVVCMIIVIFLLLRGL